MFGKQLAHQRLQPLRNVGGEFRRLVKDLFQEIARIVGGIRRSPSFPFGNRMYDRLSIFGSLLFADARHVEQLRFGGWLGFCEGLKRRVVENHVGWDLCLPRQLCPQGAKRLEQVRIRRFRFGGGLFQLFRGSAF